MKAFLKGLATSAASTFGPHVRGDFSNAPKLWIMMYHRILPPDDMRYQLEEPGMVVEPDTFAMHLRELKKHFDVMDFSEWIKLKTEGEPLPARACVVTFDDGWFDNVEFALPLLRQARVPATLFAVVEKIGTDFQFWPNLVSALLASKATSVLERHPLVGPALQGLGVSQDRPHEYRAAVIHQLKRFSDSDIFAALQDINWRKLLAFELPRGLMTWDEVRAMHASGLVSVGSHTCSHQRLNAGLPDEELHREVVFSKQLLTKHLPEQVDLFCFPNGDYNQASLDLVSKTYGAAVTTRRGIVDARSADLHQLTRIGVHQHVSSSPRLLGARLSGWI